MKVTADTNVLVRAIASDDRRQSKIAQAELTSADVVAVALPTLCELVWVLARGYGISAPEIGNAVRLLIDSENVVVNRRAVEAGLAVLDAGGDFADGAIAFEGRWLGANSFVSFDKQAVRRLSDNGWNARLLA
jgi:predicted nucleic-acid-binding protein